MAGEWIAYDLALPGKPEVQELIDETGEPVETVVFRLLQLWGWAAINCETGTARMTLPRLSRVCGGNVDFWRAVASVGWLDIDDAAGTVAIPDWDRRFSKAAKARIQEADRKKAYEDRNPDRRKASDGPPSAPPTPESRRGEREERGERGEDSSSPSLTPEPPPTGVGPSEWQDGWMQLRKAWNDAMPAKPWRSAEPPKQAIERLAEPGWLGEALAAIADIRRLAAGFPTPPTLKQICHRGEKGSFVARLLGGEFAKGKES